MCVQWLTNGPFVKAQHLFQIFAMICVHLMVRRPRIEISRLLNIKGRMENHLLLAKKKKAEGGSSSVRGSKCLPRSHRHTEAISSVGNAGGVYRMQRNPPD